MLCKMCVAAVVVLAALNYGYQKMTTPAWETISNVFMKSHKPYGGGAFRVRGNEVMTLKFARPEIVFKPRDERKNPDVAEPIEPWMNNSGERLSRATASFIRGTLDGGMTRYFQQHAQDGAWWYSKDWSVQYVSTGWTDMTRPVPENGLVSQIAKLWRSVDGGQTWTQLKWPEDHNISYLKFLDSQRGYAIGWGPHIWRTADGGQTWQEIELPPMATDYRKPRKQFDAVNLGPDGVLRVAYYVGMLGEVCLSSVVYRLRWDDAQFEQDVVLPNQVVVQLGSTNEPPGYTYSVYALSRLGSQVNGDDQSDNGKRIGAISTWSSYKNPTVEQLHTFDERYNLTGLDVGKRGVMLVYAGDSSRGGAPHQITFYSQEYGKSWSDIDDGTMQGGWFDSQTNTQYALYAYTLKKRQF
ncbi:WD40/YVTN/BNR-like repeat-containing protein [Paraburkholderia heleia]|uniref:WD40/YVTN/BNR-like repeat-containing protein n=1 Tax=Paraburkholderia heleia TaxID=634127 RepID=UPI000AEDF2B9|nr:glycosyl hydrolase [Paraburkholderia heleia]